MPYATGAHTGAPRRRPACRQRLARMRTATALHNRGPRGLLPRRLMLAIFTTAERMVLDWLVFWCGPARPPALPCTRSCANEPAFRPAAAQALIYASGHRSIGACLLPGPAKLGGAGRPRQGAAVLRGQGALRALAVAPQDARRGVPVPAHCTGCSPASPSTWLLSSGRCGSLAPLSACSTPRGASVASCSEVRSNGPRCRCCSRALRASVALEHYPERACRSCCADAAGALRAAAAVQA